MKHILFLLVLCMSTLAFGNSIKWKEKGTDRFVEGTFIEIDAEKKVVVRTKGRKIVRIPLARLNDICRRHAEKEGGLNGIEERLTDPYALGLYQKNQGENTKALENFRKAIEVDPKNAAAHKGIGDIYLEGRDYDKALENYDRAIEADEEFAPAYKSRGLAKLGKDEAEHGAEWTDDAKRHYNKMVRENMRDHPWEPLSSLEYETPLRKLAKLDFNKALYLERLHRNDNKGTGGGDSGVGSGAGSGVGPIPSAPGQGIVIGSGLAQGLGEGAGEATEDGAEAVTSGLADIFAPFLKIKPKEKEKEVVVGEAVGSGLTTSLMKFIK